MISFIVTLLIIILIVYLVKLLLDQLSLPGNINTIIYILLAIVVIVWLLQNLGIRL